MKVALTEWEGRVSPMFDVCREVVILAIESGKVTSTTREAFDGSACGSRVDRLVSLGVEVLICGAISQELQQELVSRRVKVVGFVAGEIGEVVRVFMAGSLPSSALTMPGCGGGRWRFRRRLGKGPGRRGR